MSEVVEVWADTGVVVERDYTEEELAQREIDRIAAEEAEAARLVEEAAKAAKRAELLERLGITEDEAKILLG